MSVVALAGKVEGWLLRAANKAIPRGYDFARKVPWWEPGLNELRREAFKARKILQKTFDQTERLVKREEYRSKLRAYKARIRVVKDASWDKFVEDEQEKGPWNTVYKLAVGKMRPREVMVATGDDVLDWRESCNKLLNGLVVDDDVDTEEQEEVRRLNDIYAGGELQGRISVCMDDISNVLANVKNRKAPGKEGIMGEMIKEGWSVVAEVLVRLYQACFDYWVFPDRWKRGVILALLKNEDKDPREIKSYRPICLLPVMGKLLERLIVMKLDNLFFTDVSVRQFGFMRGRSTEDAMELVRHVRDTSDQPYVMGIFMDITGAFDRVWWPSVLSCMREKGVHVRLYRMIQDYLSRRRVEMKEGDGLIWKNVNRGCPQGSVLGPQLWKLVFDACVRQVDALEGVTMVAFADDAVALVEGRSRVELERRAREVTDVVENWCTRNKMLLSESKTVAMMLKGKFHKYRRPYVGYQGSRIKFVERVKYLGVTWEEGWRVVEHIPIVANRANNLFGKAFRMCRMIWGGKNARKGAVLLYKGLFLSIVGYAAGAWGYGLNVHRVRQVWACQRRALRCATKAYSTVANEALQVIAGVWPLDLELEKRWAAYTLRKKGRVEWRGREIVGRRRKLALRNVVLEEWQRRWCESTDGRWTYEWLPDVSKRLEMDWLVPGYYTTQMLSGHGNFRGKLASLGLREEGRCECGGWEEADHVMWECERFGAERDELKSRIRELGLEATSEDCMREEAYEAWSNYVTVVLKRKELEDRGDIEEL